MKIIGSLLIVGMAVLVAVGTAGAADPTVKCQRAKLKALGKVKNCLQKSAAGVLGGKDDVSATCRTKFSEALAKIDAKATDAGTACHYVDNGDGTVSDLNTGLVWEQTDSTCPGPHCSTTTYRWCSGTQGSNCANAGSPPDGTAFTTFLFGLNGGTSSNGTDTVAACFAGNCDWRLPTVQELTTIFDSTHGLCNGGAGACIDPAFGPTASSYYWSTTTISSNSNYAWTVAFTFGVNSVIKTNNAFARAVRGGL